MSVTTSRILEAKSDVRGQGVDLRSQPTQVVWPMSVVMGGWVTERVVDGVRHGPIVPESNTVEFDRV